MSILGPATVQFHDFTQKANLLLTHPCCYPLPFLIRPFLFVIFRFSWLFATYNLCHVWLNYFYQHVFNVFLLASTHGFITDLSQLHIILSVLMSLPFCSIQALLRQIFSSKKKKKTPFILSFSLWDVNRVKSSRKFTGLLICEEKDASGFMVSCFSN